MLRPLASPVHAGPHEFSGLAYTPRVPVRAARAPHDPRQPMRGRHRGEGSWPRVTYLGEFQATVRPGPFNLRERAHETTRQGRASGSTTAGDRRLYPPSVPGT